MLHAHLARGNFMTSFIAVILLTAADHAVTVFVLLAFIVECRSGLGQVRNHTAGEQVGGGAGATCTDSVTSNADTNQGEDSSF